MRKFSFAAIFVYILASTQQIAAMTCDDSIFDASLAEMQYRLSELHENGTRPLKLDFLQFPSVSDTVSFRRLIDSIFLQIKEK